MIDSTFEVRTNGYSLTEVSKTDSGHTIRVSVIRDFYDHQSSAAVYVLTPALAWTQLVSAPASDWFADTLTRSPIREASDLRACLEPIAHDLATRAAAILSGL